MVLTWIKPEELKSGSVFLFSDGFVRMYLGVEDDSRNSSMLFYTLCGVVSEDISKTEKSLVWEDIQWEAIRNYLINAVSSDFNKNLIKKSRVLSLFPLSEFSVPESVVSNWLSKNNVKVIKCSCSEGYTANKITSNVVKVSQIEVGRVYLYTLNRVGANSSMSGRYMPFVPLQVRTKCYTGIYGVPILDMDMFSKNPEDYVVSSYNMGNVDFLRNRRILNPHGDFEFLANKVVRKSVIKELLEK